MDLVSAGRALGNPNEHYDPHAKWRSRKKRQEPHKPSTEENRKSSSTEQQRDQNASLDGVGNDGQDEDLDDSSSDQQMTDFSEESLSRTRTLQLEKTMTMSGGTETAKRHNFMTEAASQGSRMSKKLINLLIWLPTDLSLSLSKGFHNAPKLYHDQTVKATPKVIGVRSGFRAAGQVRHWV